MGNTVRTEQRYVITGPPGSGKTPVLRQLAVRGFAVINEPARLVIAAHRAVGGDGVYDRNPRLFWTLMLRQALHDFRQAAASDARVFFNRRIPDLVGYAELFGLDPSEALGGGWPVPLQHARVRAPELAGDLYD